MARHRAFNAYDRIVFFVQSRQNGSVPRVPFTQKKVLRRAGWILEKSIRGQNESAQQYIQASHFDYVLSVCSRVLAGDSRRPQAVDTRVPLKPLPRSAWFG